MRGYTKGPVKPSGTPEQWVALTDQLDRLRRWEEESNTSPTAKVYREMAAAAAAKHLARTVDRVES